MDAASDKLVNEFRTVVAAAEELLNAAAGEHAEQLYEMLNRTEEALRAARARLEGAGQELDHQVRRHPLAAVGIAAALGVALGILLARK
jgi:ElaB/YqjD/DUF883 family membrane-anchored ribosome-binding protein